MRVVASMLAVMAVALFATFASAGATPASAEPLATKVADTSLHVEIANGNRVCCKRGYRDWWSTWRQCRRSGGYVVSNRQCRDDRIDFRDYRVCCKRGYRDWWSTARQCRRVGGHRVSNWQCRNG
jgi:hypothetical protein